MQKNIVRGISSYFAIAKCVPPEILYVLGHRDRNVQLHGYNSMVAERDHLKIFFSLKKIFFYWPEQPKLTKTTAELAHEK